jgi:hypothetical protein
MRFFTLILDKDAREPRLPKDPLINRATSPNSQDWGFFGPPAKHPAWMESAGAESPRKEFGQRPRTAGL